MSWIILFVHKLWFAVLDAEINCALQNYWDENLHLILTEWITSYPILLNETLLNSPPPPKSNWQLFLKKLRKVLLVFFNPQMDLLMHKSNPWFRWHNWQYRERCGGVWGCKVGLHSTSAPLPLLQDSNFWHLFAISQSRDKFRIETEFWHHLAISGLLVWSI